MPGLDLETIMKTIILLGEFCLWKRGFKEVYIEICFWFLEIFIKRSAYYTGGPWKDDTRFWQSNTLNASLQQHQIFSAHSITFMQKPKQHLLSKTPRDLINQSATSHTKNILGQQRGPPQNGVESSEISKAIPGHFHPPIWVNFSRGF